MMNSIKLVQKLLILKKFVMLKEYVICEELINGIYGLYTIRVNTDCSPLRFKIIADFDTFEEADKYIKLLKKI